MYKVFVATKGQPTLREVEFGSQDWFIAHSLVEEPDDLDDDIATMFSNPNVSTDEAYIFANTIEDAEIIAHSFIYDEPFLPSLLTPHEEELAHCFFARDMDGFNKALRESPIDYAVTMIDNDEEIKIVLENPEVGRMELGRKKNKENKGE